MVQQNTLDGATSTVSRDQTVVLTSVSKMTAIWYQLDVLLISDSKTTAIWYQFDVVFISDSKTFAIWYPFAVVFILTPHQQQNDIN